MTTCAHQSEHETFLWQKSKLLTIEICWQNLLTKCESANYRNLLTESADKKRICWREKSADRICWQKPNLLTTKRPCRLDGCKPLLKTLHHASQAMASAHISSVKFNAWMCAWAGPSSTILLANDCTQLLNKYDSLIQYNTIQYDVTTVVNFFYLYCEL